jgi:hypothetical protein
MKTQNTPNQQRNIIGRVAAGAAVAIVAAAALFSMPVSSGNASEANGAAPQASPLPSRTVEFSVEPAPAPVLVVSGHLRSA